MDRVPVPIDVSPVEQSSERSQKPPYYREVPEQKQYDAYVIADAQNAGQQAKAQKGGVFSALVRIVLGAFLVLIGLPMLILPGPGLLAIGAGIVLIVSGVGSILRKPGNASSNGQTL